MLTRGQQDFIKLLNVREGSQPRVVFWGWLEAAFTSIAGIEPDVRAIFPDVPEDARDARLARYVEMSSLCDAGVQADRGDFLGPVAGEIGALNDRAGQFFTPWEIALLMASMQVPDMLESLHRKPVISVGEPACGSGAMVLALIRVLTDAGITVPWRVWFEVGDLDRRCCLMTFVQMSLVGSAGVVRQENALTQERWMEAYIPIRLRPEPKP